MSVVLGLDHVQIAMPAGEEAAARVFYGELLGLDELPKPEPLVSRGGVWFRCGELEIHLGVELGFRPAKKAHAALIVDDLDVFAERLGAAGHDVKEAEVLGGRRRFHSADPFGNRLELMASAPAAPPTDG